ncbi:hypothetical protein HN51_044937 [Arachis hypogaea]|uniref:Uncharacterized protein n=2 Tax=Arachis hypogaea TaxID=3818 RepID=A0A444Y1T7_ARAHY|nr:hypothetical protein Ahy_B08g091271 isoform A [Arachis hypogaea]
MSLFSALLSCFKAKSREDKGSMVAVEAGSLSRKPEKDPKPSSAPIVVSYFPVNSQPSRL